MSRRERACSISTLSSMSQSIMLKKLTKWWHHFCSELARRLIPFQSVPTDHDSTPGAILPELVSFFPYLLLHPTLSWPFLFQFLSSKSSWPCKTFSWPCKTPPRVCYLCVISDRRFYVRVHGHRVSSPCLPIPGQLIFSFLVYPSWAFFINYFKILNFP